MSQDGARLGSVLCFSLFAFFLTLFVPGNSQAAIRIEDPLSLLPASDQFLGKTAFTEAFHCGDRIGGENDDCVENCDSHGCTETCQTHKLVEEVTACGADSAVITDISSDGKTESTPISRELYEKNDGNFLRLFIDSVDSLKMLSTDDFVQLDKAEPVNVTVNGTQVIQGLQVFLTLNMWDSGQNKYLPYPLYVTLGRGIPALSQLLNTGMSDDTGLHPFFKVISYSRK